MSGPPAQPGVSVVLSTFNYSAVLPYSIASALAQSVAPLEVLVVGDHCTDDSEEVVARTGDDRVRFINLATHTGIQSGPNNEGLAQARGDIIAYLGHDDLWLPDHLAHLAPALAGGADVAYEMALLVTPGRSTTVAPAQAYRPGLCIPPTVLAHWRTASDRVGGWRLLDQLHMSPDNDISARMHSAGLRMQFVPRVGAIKFAAAHRPGVYQERPCHEQAAWAARLSREPDLEAAETARLLGPGSLASAAAGAAGGDLITTLTRELARRARYRLTARYRHRSRDFRRFYADIQREKGLP
ncbi:MAG: glycosyltransferase family 2 protein [Actinomycetota bacterium]|nr:glycosyltransferase family 2 protein [Actinomycetota bacterium]